MSSIRRIFAREILDSRGRPTVEATCELESGEIAAASVPSGASTGKAEALELRDGDEKRYSGLGCLKAVANVNTVIAKAIAGEKFETQAAFDQRLIELDGTENKSRLGANAILACSIAFARASALRRDLPLYAQFASMIGAQAHALPRLTINLFSGGKHAGGQVEIQDILLVPLADSVGEGLAQVHSVYYAAARLGGEKYNMRLLRADEGGLAPPAPSVEALLEDAVTAIRRAGLEPGEDMALALDVASSHFFSQSSYHLGAKPLSSDEMIQKIDGWTRRFPIISVEDGLAEDEWRNWPQLRKTIGDKALILGDDLLCTNPLRIRRAIEEDCATALLLKVNQIGTLTEAAEARRLAKGAGWKVVVSARSGETEDDWLADLATAWGDQIKVGSITQSERLAKYNRLLEIEAETQWRIGG